MPSNFETNKPLEAKRPTPRVSRLLLRNVSVVLALICFTASLLVGNPEITNVCTYSAILALMFSAFCHVWIVVKPWR